jgi:alpha-beta hydrolase superfamily lysophospholipase
VAPDATGWGCQTLSGSLCSTVFPILAAPIPDGGPGADALSRDPQVVAQANADPLMHSVATLRWGTETLQAIATVRAQIRNLKTPILLIHGDADRVNAVDGSQELYARITYPDKTLKIYPGGYHELHNDLDREQVLLDLLDWLDAHVRN